MADEASTGPSKKQKTNDVTAAGESRNAMITDIVPAGQGASGSSTLPGQLRQASQVPKSFERLTLTVNPSYLTRLKASHELGFERPFDQRRLPKRHYEIQIENLRNSMSYTLTNFLYWRFHEQGRMTATQIGQEVLEIVPICVDACMAALYAKLRNIHKQYGTFAHRFNTPASYSKDVELPLPFADAIQNFGVFETRCMRRNFLMVPVYPEGTRNEGRASEDWSVDKYEACVPVLRSCGVPVKNIDPRAKYGSAWWTYQIERTQQAFDLRCILPLLHYSEHSAILASVFIFVNAAGQAAPIIRALPDDIKYGLRLREIRPGFQIRAFAALCHAPNEDWNTFTNLD